MRSIPAIVAVLASLCGCEQTPDFVATSPSLNEAGTAGMGGTSGIGGMGGAGGGEQPDDCDASFARAVIAFKFEIENCTYDSSDAQLKALLDQHIYSQRAPALSLFEAEDEANRDAICEAASAILPEPLPWRYAIENGDITRLNEAIAVICPRYCLLLGRWLDEHYPRVEHCLP